MIRNNGIFRWISLSGGFIAGLASHAALAEEHEGTGGLPQFDPSTYPSQLFWLAVTFVVLFVFFKAKTLPEIGGVLERREAKIQEDVGKAEQLKAEAAKAQESYESLLDGARKDSTRLLAEATAAVKARADREVSEFRDRAAKDIEALETRLAQGRKKALQEMDVLAAEIASEAAARIVGIKTDLQQAQTVVQSLKKEAA